MNFDQNASVELLNWSPNEIQFKTKTTTPQFLFISEIFYPGWKLNNNMNIIQTNGLFRGLIIPSGENTYIMTFNPKDINVGNYITFFMYAILFVNILIILFY